MLIGAGKARWRYNSIDGVESGVGELAHGGRQGNAGGAQGEAGGGGVWMAAIGGFRKFEGLAAVPTFRPDRAPHHGPQPYLPLAPIYGSRRGPTLVTTV